MSTALAVRTDVVQSLDDVQRVAKLLAASGYFETKGDVQQAIAQVATKILAGREMGFSPFASVNGIHVIQGKPSVSAGMMAAAVKGSARYDYRVRQNDDSAVAIEFFERVNGQLVSLGTSTFTIEDAKRAGTQNLQKFARNMMFARAMSNGVRWYVPDVFNTSVYTPEEMGAIVDGEGNVLDMPAPSPQIVRDPDPDPDPEPEEEGDAAPWQTWNHPTLAIEWAVAQGLDIEEARAILTGIKNEEFGGKLNASNMQQVFQQFHRYVVAQLDYDEVAVTA